jgi:hypothetical protein
MKNQDSNRDDARAFSGAAPQGEQEARDMEERRAEGALLITRVRAAFQHVELGSGVGLHEGQALYGYGTDEEQQTARDGDEKLDWRLLLSDDLEHCASSLSFFDAEGMRFHLPAFLIGEIEGSLQNSLSIRFSTEPDFSRSPFNMLNAEQQSVVRDCLAFLNQMWNESAG